MKTLLSKTLVLSGVCALLAGAGHATLAQGYDHHDWHFDQGRYGRDLGHDGWALTGERQRLARLHRVYTRDARSGRYAAAERAHLHAQAIRADLRAQRHDIHREMFMHRDWDHNHGY